MGGLSPAVRLKLGSLAGQQASSEPAVVSEQQVPATFADKMIGRMRDINQELRVMPTMFYQPKLSISNKG